MAEKDSNQVDVSTIENGKDLKQDVVDNSLFGDIKLKKKKKKKVDLDAFEAELNESTRIEDGNQDVNQDVNEDINQDINQDQKDPLEEDESALFGDLKAKKKKKKKVDLEAFEAELNEVEGVEGENEEETWKNSDRDYTYQELVHRFFKILRQNNPELAGEKRKYTIVPPSVHRDGNKKSVFANIMDICKRMHRQPEHVIQFLFAELGTTGSVDGNQQLVIKGRFQQKQIEAVLRRYIVEYVTCKTCKSPDTILTKENRIYFMNCESCGSTRSVTTIKTGFKAQTEKRKH